MLLEYCSDHLQRFAQLNAKKPVTISEEIALTLVIFARRGPRQDMSSALCLHAGLQTSDIRVLLWAIVSCAGYRHGQSRPANQRCVVHILSFEKGVEGRAIDQDRHVTLHCSVISVRFGLTVWGKTRANVSYERHKGRYQYLKLYQA